MAKWVADWDDGCTGWQPRLIAPDACPSLDIWFPAEQECLDWIAQEIEPGKVGEDV